MDDSTIHGGYSVEYNNIKLEMPQIAPKPKESSQNRFIFSE
jgi:hypothetical protein